MTHRISEHYEESADPDSTVCAHCRIGPASAIAPQMAAIRTAEAMLAAAIESSRHYRCKSGKTCPAVTALLRGLLDQVPGYTLLKFDQVSSILDDNAVDDNAHMVQKLMDRGELSPVRMANGLWYAAHELRACLLRKGAGTNACLISGSRTAADCDHKGACAHDADERQDESPAINATEDAPES